MSHLSPLNDYHKELGACFTDFSGWQMPLHYGSILKEHMQVRESVGIFDISHMGSIFVSGAEAERWLSEVLANDACSLETLQAHYTFLLNSDGGVIDDLIIYRITDETFLLVPNASGVQAVAEHLTKHLPEAGVKLENRSGSVVSIAVQGKQSVDLVGSIWPETQSLKKNQLIAIEGSLDAIIIARTGYTGSEGFEIFTNIEQGRAIWQQLLSDPSAQYKCKPCGLGSRDTLRIEAGYPLYGHELNQSLTPIQAGLGFFVKNTLKSTLKEALPENLPRIAYYKILAKTPPPRGGYEIYEGETLIGSITSGCLSPMTGEGIGFALVNSKICLNDPGKYIILIRNKKYPLKFIKRGII